MGFVRPVRYAMMALIVLGVMCAIPPFASANPIVTADYYVVQVPILLVLLNFPIDGLMLWVMYRLGPGEPAFHRGRGPRTYLIDFWGIVLLFAMLGALIDYLAWMGVWWGFNELAFFYLSGGIAAIGATTYLFSRRLLAMDRDISRVAALLAVLVNLISWGFLTNSDMELLAIVCIPVVLACWVAFEVLTVITAVSLRTKAADPGPRLLAPSDGQELPRRARIIHRGSVNRTFRIGVWWANALMTVVLLAISFFMVRNGFV